MLELYKIVLFAPKRNFNFNFIFYLISLAIFKISRFNRMLIFIVGVFKFRILFDKMRVELIILKFINLTWKTT